MHFSLEKREPETFRGARFRDAPDPKAWRQSASTRRKTVVKASPKTMVDAQARVRELEAEVRKLTLEKDILKKAAAYFAREQS